MPRPLSQFDWPRFSPGFLAQLKRFLSFTLVEVVARGLNWPILFVLPLFLTTEEYGVVRLIVAIEAITTAVFLFGQNRSVLRFYNSEKDPAALLATVLLLCGGMGLLLFLLLLICSTFRSDIAGVPIFPHLLVLLPAVGLSGLGQLCLAFTRATQSSRRFAQFRIGIPLLKFVGVVTSTWLLGLSLGYPVGLVAGLGALSIGMVPYLCRHAAWRFDRKTAVRLLAFGWPFLFHILGASLLGYVSLFMLGALADKATVGLYGFAVTLGSSVFLVYAALSSYFEPMIYRFAGNQSRSERWLAVYGFATTSVASLLGIAILTVLPAVLSRFYPPEYGEVLAVLPIVLAAILSRPVYLQGNYRLVVYERPRFIASGTLLAGAVNMVACWLLVPRLGLLGAGYAFFLSSILLAVYLYLASLFVGGVPWRRVDGLLATTINLAGCVALAASPRLDISVVILATMFATSMASLIAVMQSVGVAKARVSMAHLSGAERN